MTWQPWDAAWRRALYGPGGFFRRQAPASHIRTAAHVGDLFGAAVARLARRCSLRRVVDIGCGRGELLAAVHRHDGDLELVGVDVVERPPDLPARLAWLTSPGGSALPDGLDPWLDDALVLAVEWLDNVPCPVVQLDDDGWHRLLVDPATGTERPDRLATPADITWLNRWWPIPDLRPHPAGHPVQLPVGQPSPPPSDRPPHLAGSQVRAEVGTDRDDAWASLVRRARAQAYRTSRPAVLLAVDYAHHRGDRPPGGSLIGYRDGRACTPVPDGSCDVTAHVAMDAVAAAGRSSGACDTAQTVQRTALTALGVNGSLPDVARATADPRRYLADLTRAGQGAELLDQAGLGGFGWLAQQVGPDPSGRIPHVLAALDRTDVEPTSAPRPSRRSGIH
ncbi:MAG: SAM-dependent methyltransferase [Angustibacter sp.]